MRNVLPMRAVRRVVLPAALLLVGGCLVATGAPAQALQAPVAFTSTAVSTYQTNGPAWTVVASGGLVFVGGSFTSVRPPGDALGTNEFARAGVAVLDAGTGRPTACAPKFLKPSKPTSAIVRSLAVSPDGKTLYAGGNFETVNGVAQSNLAAIDIASCSLVTTFRPAPSSVVRSIAATASTVYFGGEFGNVGGTARVRAAAVAAVGATNPGSLLPWAPALDQSFVNAVALKPDGSQVVLGGDFDNVNGTASNALAVVDATTGATIKAYPGLIESRSTVKGLTVDSTGFYTANEGTGSGAFDGRLAIDWSTLNLRWRNGCLGATQSVVVYKTLLYAASHAHDCSPAGGFSDGPRHHLSAESTATGPALQNWWPDTDGGTGEKVGPRSLAVATAGGADYLWVAGEFTAVNGIAQQGLTRFGQTNNAAKPDTPQLSVTSFKAGQVQVAWKPSFDTDDLKLTYRLYRDGGATPVYTTTSSANWWKRTQVTYLDSQTAGTAHTYKVTASDGINAEVPSATRSVTVASASSAYAARILTDDPAMYWRYDEVSGLMLADSSAHNQNANARSGTYGVTGAISGDPSKAITLGGGQATIWAENRIAPPTTYSLETWFKTTSSTGGEMFGFGNKTAVDSNNIDKVVYLTDAGRLVFGVAATVAVPQTISSLGTYNDGAWHHVVATQGSSGMRLYVDGLQVASNSVTTNGTGVTGYWHVGGDGLQSWWPQHPTATYLAASFDESAIYSSALSGSTVSAHYLQGK